jgi:hypothetical protein
MSEPINFRQAKISRRKARIPKLEVITEELRRGGKRRVEKMPQAAKFSQQRSSRWRLVSFFRDFMLSFEMFWVALLLHLGPSTASD